MDLHSGNLRNWWSNATLSSFRERARCLVEQYDSFVSAEVNETVNGEATQAENIADVMGYDLAYQAYRLWMEERGDDDERTLPGLHFTPSQMFWISRGRSYCRKMTEESQRSLLLTGRVDN